MLIDCKFILEIKPRKIPSAPLELIEYLIMDDRGRSRYNVDNAGIWKYYDSETTNQGFFSCLRSTLAHNGEWLKIFQDELKKPENSHYAPALQAKIKEFCKELYVDPLVGKLPYFRKWAPPDETEQPRRNQNWND